VGKTHLRRDLGRFMARRSASAPEERKRSEIALVSARIQPVRFPDFRQALGCDFVAREPGPETITVEQVQRAAILAAH
jgi:hypothetical protein